MATLEEILKLDSLSQVSNPKKSTHIFSIDKRQILLYFCKLSILSRHRLLPGLLSVFDGGPGFVVSYGDFDL